MLNYTGHYLIDIGIAAITAFAGKRNPKELTSRDLDAIADYMIENYIVDPLKSFLTVVFPNSGFTNPAFEKHPEKRKAYAEKVLRAYRPGTPVLDIPCIFTRKPAVGLSLDTRDKLDLGRAFRQHVPLTTGEGIVNFHPYGNAGLPVSGEALLAIHAFPLGCAKVGGRLLAVHADNPQFTYRFAKRFLHQNRRTIHAVQSIGGKKIPEPKYRATTLLIQTLLEIEEELQWEEELIPSSITAYHLSNSGQGVKLDIYQLPLEITDFLIAVRTPEYREGWDAICRRGWEITRPKRRKDGTQEQREPTYNAFYEDLFHLPDGAASFIRTYFLRIPKQTKRKGDPRSTYSLKQEANLVSWKLTDLFLRRVVKMEKARIEYMRNLGDTLADYIVNDNDRRFFHVFLTARSYGDLRTALIKASHNRIKRRQMPLITFDQFIAIFEEGEEIPRSDWRLARDLVLIRMIERLYAQGWLQEHVEELPEPEVETSGEK
jgi:CRISPR-associated protein Cst1